MKAFVPLQSKGKGETAEDNGANESSGSIVGLGSSGISLGVAGLVVLLSGRSSGRISRANGGLSDGLSVLGDGLGRVGSSGGGIGRRLSAAAGLLVVAAITAGGGGGDLVLVVVVGEDAGVGALDVGSGLLLGAVTLLAFGEASGGIDYLLLSGVGDLESGRVSKEHPRLKPVSSGHLCVNILWRNRRNSQCHWRHRPPGRQ